MKDTWHFTLPETLLLPTTHQLAVQQGISTLNANKMRGVLSAFQAFSIYANLPLGLSPQKSRAFREELERIKSNPNSRISDISSLVKKIRTIKDLDRLRKQIAKQKQLSVFSVYESDDLITITSKILTPISNYIKIAKKELGQRKPPKQPDHPIIIFKQFVQQTENLLHQHQMDIAHSMLLRLQAADLNNDITYDDVIQTLDPSTELGPARRQLSRHHFIAFHTYIEKYGNTETKAALKKLSWFQSGTISLNDIIHPKRAPWPRWFFRGETALHQAFSDIHHQAAILLKIRKLETIDSTDPQQLSLTTDIHRSLIQESQRLTKLNNKLFRWFHSKEYRQISKRIDFLNKQCNIAAERKESIQKQIKQLEEKQRQQEIKRASILKRSHQYSSKIAEIYFLEFIKQNQKNITIDGLVYPVDRPTWNRMKHALKNVQNIQIALLKKMETAQPDEYPTINQLITALGSSETKAIWYSRLDAYRLECFRHTILDAKNSKKLLTSFQDSLQKISIPFPKTEGVAAELLHLIELLPIKEWNEYQHQACESIESNLILGRYYKRAIDYCLSSDITLCPNIADAILQRFTEDYLLEIEHLDLKTRIDSLTERRLIDREAKTTAALIQSEIEQGQMMTALSRLKHIQHDIKSTSSQPDFNKTKRQFVGLANAFTQANTPPDELSQRLITSLRSLLHSKSKDKHYLEQLAELKRQADTLPFSQEYFTIKRLCSAGETIPSIINELVNMILGFSNNETQHISLINPLLLDIIEFDLISTSQKSLLQQLTGSVLLNPEKNLPKTELKRLTALKNALTGSTNENDRAAFFETTARNQHRLTYQKPHQPNDQPSGEIEHASRLRHN